MRVNLLIDEKCALIWCLPCVLVAENISKPINLDLQKLAHAVVLTDVEQKFVEVIKVF